MPIATIEFHLPEEAREHMAAVQGEAARLVLSDLAESIRRRIKYEELSEETAQVLEELRREFYECLVSHGIDLDD